MEIRRSVEEQLTEIQEILAVAESKYKQGLNEPDLEAIDYFKEAVDMVPDYDQAWNAMGLSYKRLSLFDKAIDCFKKATDNDQGKIEAYINLAETYVQKGDYMTSLYTYSLALADDPLNIRAMLGTATIFKSTERYTAAAQCYEKILDALNITDLEKGKDAK